MSRDDSLEQGAAGSLLRSPRPFTALVRPGPLIAAGCVFSVALGGAVFLGLRGPSTRAALPRLDRGSEVAAHPASLDALPASYGDALRLSAAEAPPPAAADTVGDAAASPPSRKGPPLAPAAGRASWPPATARADMFFDGQSSAAPIVVQPTGPAPAASLSPPQSPDVNDPVRETPLRTKSAASAPTVPALKAGDFINAALITAVDSDIPGTVVAQVTRNVFDHASGRALLIPQGARLVGRYEGRPPFGQTRAVIAWREIVMPDGRSIDLGGMAATDSAGAGGVRDVVDTHISPIMRAIALSTALTVGGAAAQSANARSTGGVIVNDAATGVSVKASEAGQRFVDRDLNRPPTVRIRPGWPVAVIVEHDLVIPAYGEQRAELR